MEKKAYEDWNCLICNSSFINKEENEKRVHMWVQCIKLQMYFTFEIDQLYQDLFSFESDNDEDCFCQECFLQGARKVVLIHLHCVVEIS